MNIGTALRYYRTISCMTQNQVAEEADINEKYYGEIERNQSSPTVERLEKICQALGVSMYQIAGYRPLDKIEPEIEKEPIRTDGRAEYYCNCCGADFYSAKRNVICPQCGCEYDEDSDYIEKYQ